MRFEIHVHHHHYYHSDPGVDEQLRSIKSNTEKIMSDLTDLQGSVAQIVSDVAAENTELATIVAALQALTSNPGVSSADIQAQVALLVSAHNSMTAAVAAAQAAFPAPAPTKDPTSL